MMTKKDGKARKVPTAMEQVSGSSGRVKGSWVTKGSAASAPGSSFHSKAASNSFSVGVEAQAGQIVAFDIDPVSSKSTLSGRVAMQLVEGSLTREDVRMVIPDRTLERRIKEDQPLTLDEADAIIRLLRVTEAARRLFEDNARADHWLRSPNPALGGAMPIRLARTDVGGRSVEQVLGRLEYGIYT